MPELNYQLISIILSTFIGITAIIIAYRQLVVSKKTKPLVKIESNSREFEIKHDYSYKKILQKQPINVGFLVYPPTCVIDDKTNAVGGVGPEILKSVSERLDLDLNYTRKVVWDDMIESLYNYDFDILCTLIWDTDWRSKEVDFLTPIFYSPINVYVKDTSRIKKEYSYPDFIKKFNKRNYRLSIIKNELTEKIGKRDLPNVEFIELPTYSDNYQLLQNVIAGKSDFALVEPYIAHNFNQGKPNSVRNIVTSEHLVYSNCFMVRKNEDNFKTKMNIALNGMIRTGEINRILTRNNPEFERLYEF